MNRADLSVFYRTTDPVRVAKARKRFHVFFGNDEQDGRSR
jgi:hypothetical protein